MRSERVYEVKQSQQELDRDFNDHELIDETKYCNMIFKLKSSKFNTIMFFL